MNLIVFVILFVMCYHFYMKEAIEKFRLGATTVTKRSEYLPYEAPSLIICPEPGFKQSVFKRYIMTLPARYVFQDTKYLKALFSKIKRFKHLVLHQILTGIQHITITFETNSVFK